jgi:hypothetical protein
MIRVLIFCLFGLACCSSVKGQETPPPKSDVVQQMAANPFRRELLKAIPAGVERKEITRAQAMTLRAACFSPAFLRMAEVVARVQMSMSGEDVPEGEDGKLEVRDWSAFFDFLVKLLPILLDLIDRFSFLQQQSEYLFAFGGLSHDYFTAA